jgi:hypothetical protein
VDVAGDNGAVVTSNTILTSCHVGVSLSGGDIAVTVANNIVETGLGSSSPQPCTDPATATGVAVAADSLQGTSTDYNLIDPVSGEDLYDWAGTGYTSFAAFTAATGQGTHDLAANPMLTARLGGDAFWYGLTAGPPRSTPPTPTPPASCSALTSSACRT